MSLITPCNNRVIKNLVNKGYTMSMEIVGVWATKLGIGAVVAYLGWDYRKIRKKAEDSYTKKEVSDLVDLKIKPLTQKIDTSTQGLIDKFDLLLVLVKENTEKNANRIKEDSVMLHKISTSVAVIESEVGNLKERMNDKGD